MKLVEALNINRRTLPENARRFRVYLACGFTPLHLQTFLSACLRERLPDRRIEIATGLYGDLPGNLRRMGEAGADAGVAVLEWPDLDPRLGLRQLGGWGPGVADDILGTAGKRIETLCALALDAARHLRLAVSMPTLPLAPVTLGPPAQAAPLDLGLRDLVTSAARRLADSPGIRILRQERLDLLSPLGERQDIRSMIQFDFPYRHPHTSALAEMLASLTAPAPPKKGLITDLDDTLWKGIVGEEGIDGIAWDLDHHAIVHGLYQQLLSALADSGVLLAIASKNDAALVQTAFERRDTLLRLDQVYPAEVHWTAKSDSVGRILKAWNVGEDSVVFVDDSPLELAEVKSRYPGIECQLFPKDDDEAAYAMLHRLRDIFGKETITEEDRIRLQSLRRLDLGGGSHGSIGDEANGFMKQAEAEVSINMTRGASDGGMDRRAFDLVNKTNQFNLNGARYTEGEWRAYMGDPRSFVLVASYKDKYGPLGKVAVVLGRRGPAGLVVDTWVMSCRAFSRSIEFRCLDYLFQRFDAGSIELAFTPTPRNGPLQEFLAGLLPAPPDRPVVLQRDAFVARCPDLYHTLVEERPLDPRLLEERPVLQPSAGRSSPGARSHDE